MTPSRNPGDSGLVTLGKVLRRAGALNSKNQHVRFVLLDVFWRVIWLAGSTGIVAVFWVVLVSQLTSIQWVGPDLGVDNPIILLAALRTFWRTLGSTVLFELALVGVTSVGLWILLEALFRGGRQGFWVYCATSAARVAFLAGTMILFGTFAMQDEGMGTLIVGGVFLLALVFILTLIESVVRRNAVELLALNLMGVAGVIAVLLSIEGLLAFVLWGSTAAALLSASGGAEIALALAVSVVAAMFWMVVQSYLVAVRYAAIDIMRQHVVG
jgi:hypothetical protein